MNNTKLTTGVFLTRCQPLTSAHVGIIEMIAKENEQVCVIIGSADKSGTERNPFDIESRIEFIEKSLYYIPNLIVFGLNDWENENNVDTLKNWGHYLYYNVISRINNKKFNFYYSDGEDILNTWFDEEVRPYINYVINDRNVTFDGLSATKVRNLILDKKFDEVRPFITEYEYQNIDYLYGEIVRAYNKK